MCVTALWSEVWTWIAATRPQDSASVSQVIRVFAVKPARRVCTWIVLPGSVCHVTVVHMEPSAYSATGKQQKLKVKLILFYHTHKKASAGFPGGAVVENLPANAGDTGSSPGLGGSHMPRSGWAREPQLLSLRVWSLCSATREAARVSGLRIAMKSGPRLPQLERALARKRRPNTAINRNK